MKRFLVIMAVFAVVAVVFANTAIWLRHEKPTISLTDAVKLTTDALNKKGDDFYCLRADILQSGGQCVWDLDFCSTNGTARWVEVGADKRVQIRTDGPFAHD
jgi:hypothetical protein